MASEYLVVLTTCPDRTIAERLADTVVHDGGAACVNIIPGLTSVYRWQGEVHHDTEILLVMKTAATAFPDLRETVLRLHPDEVPEIVAIPVAAGLDRYLGWVSEQTARPSP